MVPVSSWIHVQLIKAFKGSPTCSQLLQRSYLQRPVTVYQLSDLKMLVRFGSFCVHGAELIMTIKKMLPSKEHAHVHTIGGS